MRTDLDFTPELADLVSFMSRVAIAIRMHTPYNTRRRGSAEDNNKHILWLADSIHSFGNLADAIKVGNIQSIIFEVGSNIDCYRMYMTVGGKWVSDPMLTFKTVEDFSGEHCDGWILSEGIALLERISAKAQQTRYVHTELSLLAELPSAIVEIDTPHWEDFYEFSVQIIARR